MSTRNVTFCYVNLEDDSVNVRSEQVGCLIADWYGDAMHCPCNDAPIKDAIVDGKSIIGTIGGKKATFGRLMRYLTRTAKPSKPKYHVSILDDATEVVSLTTCDNLKAHLELLLKEYEGFTIRLTVFHREPLKKKDSVNELLWDGTFDSGIFDCFSMFD